MSEHDDYLWDRSGPPDPEVQRLERLLAPLAHDRPLDELRLRRKRPRWVIPAVIAAIVAAAAVLLLVLRTPSGCRGFTYETDGARSCLAVGEALDTGAGTAKVAIADIGFADLAPGTRIVLERSEAGKRQQLHLDHGKMHAKVSAPPRIFAVTTAASSVTDLGCEYTIDVGTTGTGLITVQSGKVELESCTHAVIVAPAGTSAHLRECGAGLTFVPSASAELRAAITGYDAGTAGALDRVLALAGSADAITLANLAYVVPDGPDRTRVLERLAVLHAPSPDTTVRAVLADPRLLDRWREDVVLELVVQSIEEGNSPRR